MALHPLDETQRQVVFSRLPDLRTDEQFSTKNPSISKWQLHVKQVHEVGDFEGIVRRELKGLQHPWPPKTTPPLELHGVGNELGVQSRLLQHISQEMNGIFHSLGLQVEFADYEYGTHRSGVKVKKGRKGKSRVIPDIVMVREESHHICAVGEVKTPWTFIFNERKKDPIDLKTWLAGKFGQVARYMDEFQCLWGFYTTYKETWFLYRKDRYHFQVSKAVNWCWDADDQKLSLREAFLFLATKAANEKTSYCPVFLGPDLTSGNYDPPKVLRIPDVGSSTAVKRKSEEAHTKPRRNYHVFFDELPPP